MIASSGEVWWETVFRIAFHKSSHRPLLRTLVSTSVPLVGYEYRLRRIYFVLRCEAGLVEREARSSARIDEQQWLFERHVAERPDPRHLDFASRDGDFQLIAELIAELLKIVGVDVRDPVAVRT